MTSKHKSLTKKGYALSKKKLSSDELDELKAELTVTPIINPDYGAEAQSYEVYQEDKKYIYLPKCFAIEKYGEPKKILIKEKKIKIKFKGKLRKKQMLIAKKCLSDIKEKGGGIISLHTGAGKTVIALYLACQLGLKTLVIVHKTFLQNQWYDRIKQFTNAKIGMIRQKKKDVEGKDIVIGMLQSISMIDYDPKIFVGIGFLVFDECHHIPSRVFSRALLKVGCRHTIGLSATPTRSDGMIKIAHWYLGDIIYKLTRSGSKNVIVKLFNYESNNKLFCEKKRWIKGKIIPDVIKMVTNLHKINCRNKFIINIISAIRRYPYRKVLVLSGRLEHIDKLKNMIDEIIKKEEADGIIEPGEYTTSKYIGGMKEYELNYAAEADIIFGSYSMAEEGLDIDQLNTLIFATPKKNIIQSIGRIMRKPLENIDIKPLIIDIADQYSVFKNWTKMRKKYYNKKKYSIDTYQAWNNDCINIKDFLIAKKIVKKNDKNIDVIKEYICYKYGPDHYELVKDLDDRDDSEYIYDSDLYNIFNIHNDNNDNLDIAEIIQEEKEKPKKILHKKNKKPKKILHKKNKKPKKILHKKIRKIKKMKKFARKNKIKIIE